MKWYLMPWKKYATFGGRARRKEYWSFSLVNTVISWALFLPSQISDITMYVRGENVVTPTGLAMLLWAGLLFALAAFLPSLAVTVRRLHYTGRTGWWILISLVPFGGLVIFVFTLLGSVPSNHYGPPPEGLGDARAADAVV
jgi:uncharacterized membrane protein YhaH (DUF805 family)